MNACVTFDPARGVYKKEQTLSHHSRPPRSPPRDRLCVCPYEPTMSGATTLEEVFQTFCAFGGGMKDSCDQMDNVKFSKFCRDMKLLDKKLTAIDVDIMFAQVKL